MDSLFLNSGGETISSQVEMVLNSNFSVQKVVLGHSHSHSWMCGLGCFQDTVAGLSRWDSLNGPAKPKLFMVWPFVEKAGQSSCRRWKQVSD